MADDERVKWDKRYAEPGYRMGDGPKRFLVELQGLLPRRGTVLDLGCGEGQNLVWLAGRGLKGTGVDISSVGLKKARALAEAVEVQLELIAADLDTWSPGERTWDVVVCSHLLIRDLVPRMRRALAPGGVVLMELVMEGGPLDPRYCVEPNEVLRWWIDHRVVHYRETVREGVPIVQLAARRA